MTEQEYEALNKETKDLITKYYGEENQIDFKECRELQKELKSIGYYMDFDMSGGITEIKKQKKIITSRDGHKFEQISNEKAEKLFKEKRTIFVMNIYDKEDSIIQDETMFKQANNSREDVFCLDTLEQ